MKNKPKHERQALRISTLSMYKTDNNLVAVFYAPWKQTGKEQLQKTCSHHKKRSYEIRAF